MSVINNPRGFETVTLTSSVAVGIAPAQYAAQASIQAEGGDVRWRDDGTDPTSSVGMLLKANAILNYSGDLSAIKFIAVGSGQLNVSTYS